MRIFFTLALVTGLLNSVWADNKKPALAGVYVGVVEGDKARAILKADGTMLVYPNDDEPGTVCLLYTSPSPRDATLSRMPSSA